MLKNKKKLWIGLGIALALILAVAITVAVSLQQASAGEISQEEAQTIVDEKLSAVLTNTKTLTALKEASSVTVTSMEYGLEKNIDRKSVV